MSKTNHRVNKDESEKQKEAPSHKKRREMKHVLDDITEKYGTKVIEDNWEEEIEIFEPIRRRKTM